MTASDAVASSTLHELVEALRQAPLGRAEYAPPDVTHRDDGKHLMHAAKVSESTAKRWRTKFMEQEQLLGIVSQPTKRMPMPVGERRA